MNISWSLLTIKPSLRNPLPIIVLLWRVKPLFRKAGGTTALYDAVYMGLDQIKRGTREKRP